MDSQTQCFVEMQSEIQALREELHRQRTALVMSAAGHYGQNTSQHTNHEECLELNAQMETRLQAAQSEADHYKQLVKEAFTRFKQLSKQEQSMAGNLSPKSSKNLIEEWLNMFESVSDNFSKKTILLNLKFCFQVEKQSGI